ncbi:purine nucleoside phosphorylase [Streptomyces nanshensis]|nr:purine nucleoside phosphorylase [Streptomyces nanshensis]
MTDDSRLPAADTGVIGGSGFYELLSEAEEVRVDTPFGEPADAVAVGTAGGRRVAFLPRHGRGHRFPAHEINYRANIWALRALGVRQILAPCAAGSLRRDLGPGTVVVPDQLVDRTSGRVQTFYDEGAVHVSFADPYYEQSRSSLLKAAAVTGSEAVDGGTMVVVEGPRFSTRAESRWFASQGWSLVNMTGHPEAVLARELDMCYASLALVTDLDAGIGPEDGVAQEEVFALFAQNVERLRRIVLQAVQLLPESVEELPCARATQGMTLPFELP